LAADTRRILVTGGAGYIGSHAAKALKAAGYEVVVYDSLQAGHREAVRYGALVEGNILDTSLVRRTLREHGISSVMHFAALLDVGESVRDPISYYRNNVAGALSVLEAMAAENVRQLVFSSTCATYGEPLETPITESHPQNPINSYGETKLAVERALPHFRTAYGITAAVLRYFNASGADPDGEIGEDHSPEIHLIPRAIEAANGGRGLQVFGDDYPTPDGTCLRDYIHVTDLADAHVRALEAIADTGKPTVYNLGTGRPHSVKEVIGAVEQVTGRKVPWTLAPRRPGDPAVLYAAPQKAQTELHWKPRFIEIDSIVRTAWDWHRTHPNGYRPTNP
jgi:UDP-glucose-4-epimerase GalE